MLLAYQKQNGENKMKENQALSKAEAIAYIACKLMENHLIGDASHMADFALQTYNTIKKHNKIITMDTIRTVTSNGRFDGDNTLTINN